MRAVAERYVLVVQKPEAQDWDKGIIDFLVPRQAGFIPPYPAQRAALICGDRGHAEAYAKAILRHAPDYTVTFFAEVGGGEGRG